MVKQIAREFQQVRIQIDQPRAAVEMHVAIWSNPGRGECFIGAPTLDALEARWLQITRTTLDKARAQHVLVVSCDVPEAIMTAAKEVAAER
jgi:molybdopterin-guanine dinucleotide biosynthesis protein A